MDNSIVVTHPPELGGKTRHTALRSRLAIRFFEWGVIATGIGLGISILQYEEGINIPLANSAVRAFGTLGIVLPIIALCLNPDETWLGVTCYFAGWVLYPFLTPPNLPPRRNLTHPFAPEPRTLQLQYPLPYWYKP